MSEPGIKLSKTKVSQTIDLSDAAGKDISGDPILVKKIGQRMIDFMVDRAKDGKGIDGVKLKSPYSKSYQESLAFQAAGKSKNDVNMTLSGDMLGSVDFQEDKSKITLEIADPDQAIKAYGNQTGFAGHPTIKNGPRRPFFGLSKAEIKEVLSDFTDEINAVQVGEKVNQDENSETNSIIKRISDLFK